MGLGSSGDRLCQTSPIPRSPDGDKNTFLLRSASALEHISDKNSDRMKGVENESVADCSEKPGDKMRRPGLAPEQ